MTGTRWLSQRQLLTRRARCEKIKMGVPAAYTYYMYVRNPSIHCVYRSLKLSHLLTYELRSSHRAVDSLPETSETPTL